MTATGFAFLIPALFRDHDSRFGDRRELALRPLDALLRPAAADLLTGGRLRTPRTGYWSAPSSSRSCCSPRSGSSSPTTPPPAARVPEPEVAQVIDKVQRAALPRDLRGHGGCGRRALAGSVAAGPAGDAAERRGRGLPAAVGRAARRRPRRRRRAPPGPALDRGLLDRARAGGVPRRPAPLAAGPRRPGRPVRRARDDAARRSCRRRWRGCCTTRSSRSPIAARTAGSSTSTGRRSTCPSPASGRSVSGGARRCPGGRARVRPVARRRPGAGRGRRRGGHDRAGEPASARPVRRPARRAAGSRQRLVTAADAERRRIERNLHDGAQQRLVTLALQLSLIQRRIRDDPGDAEQLVASASDELALSLAELRELAGGSTRPRSSRAWSTRSRRWSCARRYRRSSSSSRGRGCRGRSSSPRTSWRRRRWRTSPSTRAPPR